MLRAEPMNITVLIVRVLMIFGLLAKIWISDTSRDLLNKLFMLQR